MKFDAGKALNEALKMSVMGVCVLLEGSCNANCPYCLVEQEMPSIACEKCERAAEGCSRCLSGRAEDDEFIDTLYDILDHVASPQCSIALSGGEPSLSVRVWNAVAAIDRYALRNKTIATNGSGLFTSKNGVTLAERLWRGGWEICLHRNHWEKSVDDALMGYDSLIGQRYAMACRHNARKTVY